MEVTAMECLNVATYRSIVCFSSHNYSSILLQVIAMRSHTFVFHTYWCCFFSDIKQKRIRIQCLKPRWRSYVICADDIRLKNNRIYRTISIKNVHLDKISYKDQIIKNCIYLLHNPYLPFNCIFSKVDKNKFCRFYFERLILEVLFRSSC